MAHMLVGSLQSSLFGSSLSFDFLLSSPSWLIFFQRGAYFESFRLGAT